ncbi:MAG: hypothetical protein RLZ10_1186, partial [Bacteroidota bacterium]
MIEHLGQRHKAVIKVLSLSTKTNQAMNRKLFILMLLWMLPGISTVQAQISFSATGPTTDCVPFQLGFQSSVSNGMCTWVFTDPNGTESRMDSICNPSKSFITPGTYDVKLIVTYANGSKDSVEVNNFITANSAPQPSFHANITIACFQSAPMMFTNTTVGAYDSLLWDFGDGTTSTDSNPVHMYSAADTFDVKLFVYSNGCTSSATMLDYIIILNNPATSFVADTLVTCNSNQTITFTALTSSVNYTWYFGDGSSQSSNTNTAQYVYGNPGVYSVTLVTTNSLGCVDTATLLNYITIKNNPIPSISVSSGLNSCVPVYPTFSCSTPNVNSYSWDFGNNSYSTFSSSAQIYLNPGSYQITLDVTYNNGCVNTNNVVLNARPLTSAYFTVSNDSGCAPFTTTLTHQNAVPGLTYYWQLGNGTIGGTNAVQTVTYNNAGTYLPSLTVTNAFGCSNTQTA